MANISDEQESLPQMSFWDHLSELRGVLMRIAIILVALMVVFFFAMPNIFDAVVLAPCNSDFYTYSLLKYIPFVNAVGENFHVTLINTELSSQLMTHMSTAFWMSLIFAFPFVIYQLWTFVEPGLYENEKRGARKVFFAGNVLFYIGLVVGYFIVFPFSLQFLATYQISAQIQNTITLDSYIDNFLMLIFLMGIVFEMPLVVGLLSRIGLLTRESFRAFRRHAVVVLLILAAIITPSDIFSMIVVFIPLYALYELSSFVIKK